jgi:hypothetical protein
LHGVAVQNGCPKCVLKIKWIHTPPGNVIQNMPPHLFAGHVGHIEARHTLLRPIPFGTEVIALEQQLQHALVRQQHFGRYLHTLHAHAGGFAVVDTRNAAVVTALFARYINLAEIQTKKVLVDTLFKNKPFSG